MFDQLITFENYNGYQITSMVLFFVFFIGILVWTFRMKNPFIKHMENLPMNDDIKNSRSITND